uniref:Si:dkey-17e16.9 n=1 Tax=Neogobius melanostomus TaxID=47308 RepID=A0A8C6SKY2_9GOBI
MATYKVEVRTGDMAHAGTIDHIWVTLIGTEGQSEKTKLDVWGRDFRVGSVNPGLLFSEDLWYCCSVQVTTPEGAALLFPCYRWISRGEQVELREATPIKVFEENIPLLKEHRQKELTEKKDLYKSHSLSSPAAEYTADHWRDDDFFGSQFLNGVNPMMIRSCKQLPPNFPVTNEMVQPFLDKCQSLQTALKVLVIQLWRCWNKSSCTISPCDPGLCLLYLNSEKLLKPIAIQLYQQPAEDNPVFLPSDSETDWLLAKMFIRNTDIMDHQSVRHLLNTHMLLEAFIISALRNLPTVHPFTRYMCLKNVLFKLRSPSIKQVQWINPKIDFIKVPEFTKSEVTQRSLSELTYSDLCLPENITSRGLDSVPNFYYRDDGLKLWSIINRFVFFSRGGALLSLKHRRLRWVSADLSCSNITQFDPKSPSSGFPQSFSSLQDLVKFLTMVIFTSSAQHAVVNNSQYDYISWTPNASLLLVTSPPSTKGQSNMQSILDAVPNVGDTAILAILGWNLSKEYPHQIPLGSFPEEHFNEPALKQMIKEFQAELSYLNEAITDRNLELQVPYTYLLPSQLENGISR